jgi:hypothetical protein
MSKRFPQIIILSVVSCLVLCQPAFVAASTLSRTSPRTTNSTTEQPSQETKKKLRKANSYSNNKKTLANHRSTTTKLGNQEDCDACHTQCLVASLACIAISVATACAPCGVICLAYQAGCQATCNTTTACKNASLPVVNDN